MVRRLEGLSGQRVAAMLLGLCFGVAGLSLASADGLLPGLPYHYLNPPTALRRSNKPPLAGLRVLPASYMRAVQDWTIFTQDGQAGVAGSKGALGFSKSASALIVRLNAVPVPAGLVPQVSPDGNAYRVSITERPSGAPVTVKQPITVTLRWPHVPVAMYSYGSGGWKQVCYSSQALITGQTMTCRTSELGVFLAVATKAGASAPPPAPSSPSNPIGRWIPFIAFVAVVIIAAIGAYFITRSRRFGGRSP